MRWVHSLTEGPQSLEKCVHRSIMNFQKEKCQRPVTGEEQHQALMHTGGQLVKNQLCREGPAGTGEQADRKIPMWPCSKEVQEHPGMRYAEYCHQVR